MPGPVQISFTSADGEEREERWPSVEGFRLWALAQGLACTWSAYEEDADGEWAVVDSGRVGAAPPPRPGRR
jgi:hypothetical protein